VSNRVLQHEDMQEAAAKEVKKGSRQMHENAAPIYRLAAQALPKKTSPKSPKNPPVFATNLPRGRRTCRDDVGQLVEIGTFIKGGGGLCRYLLEFEIRFTISPTPKWHSCHCQYEGVERAYNPTSGYAGASNRLVIPKTSQTPRNPDKAE